MQKIQSMKPLFLLGEYGVEPHVETIIEYIIELQRKEN